jgi:hypothetical protein
MIQFAGKLAPLLAKHWPTIQKAGNLLVPGGAPTPKRFALNLAGSLAPNAFFAGMSANSLPEGASLLDRGLAFGENFLGSTAVEFGAQGLAGGGLRLAGSRIGPEGQNMIRSGIAMAVPTVAWGTGMIPQPTAQRVWGDFGRQQEEQMMAEASAREQEIWRAAREQAFAEMAGFGPSRQAYQGMFGGLG